MVDSRKRLEAESRKVSISESRNQAETKEELITDRLRLSLCYSDLFSVYIIESVISYL
jgi:hypothetical protein